MHTREVVAVSFCSEVNALIVISSAAALL